MDRLHIHFTTEVDTSGIRNNCDVLVFLNLQRAMDAGIEFFLSENKVILSPGDLDGTINSSFFEKVTDRNFHRI